MFPGSHRPPRRGSAGVLRESERPARPSRHSSASFPASSLCRVLCASAGDTGLCSTLQNGQRGATGAARGRGCNHQTRSCSLAGGASKPDSGLGGATGLGREHRTVPGTRGQRVIKDRVPPSSQCLGSNNPFQIPSALHFPLPRRPSEPQRFPLVLYQQGRS